VMALWSLTMTGMAPLVSPIVGWLGDTAGPRATVLFGVVGVGVLGTLVTWTIMRNDQLRIVLDRTRRPLWLTIERGDITEGIDERTR